jgi:hypothetical protein
MKNPHFESLIVALVVIAGTLFLAKVVGINAGIVTLIAIACILGYGIRRTIKNSKN